MKTDHGMTKRICFYARGEVRLGLGQILDGRKQKDRSRD